MAMRVQNNVVTPLYTLGLEMEISQMNPRAHTTIFGDDDARPSLMLKVLIEHDLANGRKVIAIGFNSSYAGLATGTITVVDLTRANATFQLNVAQADILAAMVVASGHSFAIDVGGLEPGPAAVIIERIAAHLSTQHLLVAPTTLAIDLVDVATPKRRMGLDANAVQQINSLLGRGFDLGARLLMAANAPSEIPLEFLRGTVQSIVTRVTGDAVVSVAKHFRDERLADESNRIGIGLASIPQGDYWFFPQTDDAFGPYLLTVPALETKVGDRDQSKRVVSAATASFCSELADEVAAAAEAAEKAEAQAIADKIIRAARIKAMAGALVAVQLPALAKTANKASAPAAPAVKAATRPTIKKVEDMLIAAGITHRPNCRARCVVTAAQLLDQPLDIVDAFAQAKSDEALRAACFGETLYNVEMVSKGVAAGLGFRFIGESAENVESFRVRLLASDAGDKVGAAGAWLRKTKDRKMPLDAESRVKAIVKAWRDHLASLPAKSAVPVAVNDDAALARAA